MGRYDNHFNARLKEFIQFKKDNGRWPDEQCINFTERSLGTWARKAKNGYNKGTLSKTREKAFIKIGFPLNVPEDEWNRNLEALKIFVLKNNRLPHNGEDLCSYSRYNYDRFHQLSEERKNMLESFRFTELWNNRSIDAKWEKKFNDLVIFYQKHHRFPNRKEDSSLEPWVITQRQRLKEGKLSSKQKSMFKKAKINLLATSRARKFKNGHSWDGNFELVVSFIKKKGRMPKNSPKASKEYHLYVWLMNQRSPIINGKLSGVQIDKLKSLLKRCTEVEERRYKFIKYSTKV